MKLLIKVWELVIKSIKLSTTFSFARVVVHKYIFIILCSICTYSVEELKPRHHVFKYLFDFYCTISKVAQYGRHFTINCFENRCTGTWLACIERDRYELVHTFLFIHHARSRSSRVAITAATAATAADDGSDRNPLFWMPARCCCRVNSEIPLAKKRTEIAQCAAESSKKGIWWDMPRHILCGIFNLSSTLAFTRTVRTTHIQSWFFLFLYYFWVKFSVHPKRNEMLKK